MDFAGGHDARTRPAGNSLDVAGPTPAVLPANPEVVNAGNSANTSEAPPALDPGGAVYPCPRCSGTGWAPLRSSAATTRQACGLCLGHGALLRHLKPLPEVAE